MGDIPIRCVERIVETDLLLTIANRDAANPLNRIVRLACGHLRQTRNMRTARCPRCEEMLRRSLHDGSADYDAFRHHGARDSMTWLADPFWVVHEPGAEIRDRMPDDA